MEDSNRREAIDQNDWRQKHFKKNRHNMTSPNAQMEPANGRTTESLSNGHSSQMVKDQDPAIAYVGGVEQKLLNRSNGSLNPLAKEFRSRSESGSVTSNPSDKERSFSMSGDSPTPSALTAVGTEPKSIKQLMMAQEIRQRSTSDEVGSEEDFSIGSDKTPINDVSDDSLEDIEDPDETFYGRNLDTQSNFSCMTTASTKSKAAYQGMKHYMKAFEKSTQEDHTKLVKELAYIKTAHKSEMKRKEEEFNKRLDQKGDIIDNMDETIRSLMDENKKIKDDMKRKIQLMEADQKFQADSANEWKKEVAEKTSRLNTEIQSRQLTDKRLAEMDRQHLELKQKWDDYKEKIKLEKEEKMANRRNRSAQTMLTGPNNHIYHPELDD